MHSDARLWPPLRVIEPVIEKFAEQYASKLRVGTSDVDQTGAIATRYEVHHLPTLLVFRAGKVVAKVVGAIPRRKLDALLAAVL